MKRNASTKVGLVIGKFAQFHRGHIDLINFALKTVDKVFILVYESPDHTSIGLSERANWIRSYFPNERIVVIEGWNAPNQHEDTPEVRRAQERYIGNVMDGIALTHIISSESYGEHLSEYLEVINVIYDKDRINRPISSTMIRNNFEEHIKQVPKEIRERIRSDTHVSSK